MRAHQYLSPWSSQQNRVPDDLLFYLLNLGVLGEWLWGCLHCTYLCLRLFRRAELADMSCVVTQETVPLVHVLLSVYLHQLSHSPVCRPFFCRVLPFAVASHLACQGTCHATCSVFVATGGGNLLLVPRLLIAVLVVPMGLVVDPFPLALLIHKEDALLPVRVGSQDTNTDVGNEGGIACRDPRSYSMNHGTSFTLVILLPCQLGLLFQLLEVLSGRVVAHAQLIHLLLMDFFDGGVKKGGHHIFIPGPDGSIVRWVVVRWSQD